MAPGLGSGRGESDAGSVCSYSQRAPSGSRGGLKGKKEKEKRGQSRGVQGGWAGTREWPLQAAFPLTAHAGTELFMPWIQHSSKPHSSYPPRHPAQEARAQCPECPASLLGLLPEPRTGKPAAALGSFWGQRRLAACRQCARGTPGLMGNNTLTAGQPEEARQGTGSGLLYLPPGGGIPRPACGWLPAVQCISHGHPGVLCYTPENLGSAHTHQIFPEIPGRDEREQLLPPHLILYPSPHLQPPQGRS